MDPVTHALTGFLLPHLGFKRKASLTVSVISSLAPDLDYITMFMSPLDFLKYHRGITHGVLALFLFPLLVGLLLRYKFKGGFFYYASLSFLSYGLHLFMDLTTQYGTMVLSPLDWTRYSLNLNFIIDPYILIGLLVAVTACYYSKKKTIYIALLFFILFSTYNVGKHYLKKSGEEFLRDSMDEYIYNIYPLPNDFLSWWFVSESKNTIKAGIVDIFTESVYIRDEMIYSESDRLVRASKKTKAMEIFLSFAKHPYPEIIRENDITFVVWRDISFSFVRGNRFSATVEYDRNGNIIDSYFVF